MCCEYGFIGRRQIYLFPLYDILPEYKVTVLDFASELLSIVFGLLLEVFLFLIARMGKPRPPVMPVAVAYAVLVSIAPFRFILYFLSCRTGMLLYVNAIWLGGRGTEQSTHGTSKNAINHIRTELFLGEKPARLQGAYVTKA